MTDEKEILKKAIRDEIEKESFDEPEKTLEETIREKNALKKKKRFRTISITLFVLLLSYAVYWLFKPFQGTLAFGICKTFLELNVPYPETLHLSEALTLRDGSIKLWYTHIDAFGEYRMEYFQCAYKADETTGATVLAQVKHNRLEMAQEKIDLFNLVIPYLVSNPPDLTMPTPLPDSLRDLQFETQKFRKPIL